MLLPEGLGLTSTGAAPEATPKSPLRGGPACRTPTESCYTSLPLSSPAVDFIKRHVRALLASVALAVGFGWVMHAGALPLFPPAGTLDNLDAGLVVAAVLTQLVSMLMRLGRVHFLLAPIAKISFPRLLSTMCITIGLITFLPFRLGEV